jgi:hypothetical protein
MSRRSPTSWALRTGIVALAVLVLVVTRGFWAAQIALSLVWSDTPVKSDVILIENFDPNYLVFERAAALEEAGVAPTAFVPVQASSGPGATNPVSVGIAEVMARQARLGRWNVVPINETEPISLNAAAQIRDHLSTHQVRSLLVVAPAFRSRRSCLVYRAVLGPAGTQVHCVAVFGRITPDTWTETWHGLQEIVQEFIKLQYYRLWVLPVLGRSVMS